MSIHWTYSLRWFICQIPGLKLLDFGWEANKLIVVLDPLCHVYWRLPEHCPLQELASSGKSDFFLVTLKHAYCYLEPVRVPQFVGMLAKSTMPHALAQGGVWIVGPSPKSLSMRTRSAYHHVCRAHHGLPTGFLYLRLSRIVAMNFMGFLVIFRDIYPAVTSILKIECSNQFWLITQSILNGFGWFLAQKIQKIRRNNPTKSEIQKTHG